MPFWLGEYKVGSRNLADEVLRRVNGVTVMSYRDTATGTNSILSISQDWLARGRAAGKRVRLGAETGPLADCPHCTFHEEGATRLVRELAKVDAATRRTAAFGGIAVHHYRAWRTLLGLGLRGHAHRTGGRGSCRPSTDERNGPAGPASTAARRTGRSYAAESRPQPDRVVAVRLERPGIVEA
nr:hypothetical protein GCM10020092_000050 [Actinoplanes digitatis]